jgi:hypothetical protein
MPRLLKTPEYKIVSDHRWQGGTVTNDAHSLKGVKSPQENDMYAIAYNPSLKMQIWFTSPERLAIWKEKTTDLINFTIKINNEL